MSWGPGGLLGNGKRFGMVQSSPNSRRSVSEFSGSSCITQPQSFPLNPKIIRRLRLHIWRSVYLCVYTLTGPRPCDTWPKHLQQGWLHYVGVFTIQPRQSKVRGYCFAKCARKIIINDPDPLAASWFAKEELPAAAPIRAHAADPPGYHVWMLLRKQAMPATRSWMSSGGLLMLWVSCLHKYHKPAALNHTCCSYYHESRLWTLSLEGCFRWGAIVTWEADDGGESAICIWIYRDPWRDPSRSGCIEAILQPEPRLACNCIVCPAPIKIITIGFKRYRGRVIRFYVGK